MIAHSHYTFDAAGLDAARPPGISALMRIRNGADFLRLVIESHLPFYDEIIACYNDCSDDTESILLELAAEHPGRVRPLHYLPKVHPPYSDLHRQTPTHSPHGLANYYNYALSHARYSIAVKLDDDHLALPQALGDAVRRIREDASRGLRKLYTFSGVNLVRCSDAGVAVYGNQPLVGTGDIMYFPVCRQIHWSQGRDYEHFGFGGLRLQKEYLGLLYFHLKHLKSCHGFGNLEPQLRRRTDSEFVRTMSRVGIAEFCSSTYHRRLRATHNPIEYWLRTHPVVQGLIFAMFGRNAPLRISRLQRLSTDVAAIDWERDLFQPLKLHAWAATGPAKENSRWSASWGSASHAPRGAREDSSAIRVQGAAN